jgi:c-di-GMP-binding flagellar brake protein YcgR
VKPETTPQPSVPEYAVTRRWERVRLSLHIRVHRTVNGVVETTDGQAQDLGEGGIAAYIPNSLSVNEQVTIEFVLPFGQRPIKFEAEVRDANGFRYGFEFVRVKENERAQLRGSIAAFAIKQ